MGIVDERQSENYAALENFCVKSLLRFTSETVCGLTIQHQEITKKFCVSSTFRTVMLHPLRLPPHAVTAQTGKYESLCRHSDKFMSSNFHTQTEGDSKAIIPVHLFLNNKISILVDTL